MLLVTSAVKTVLSISLNRMDQIRLHKQLGNRLNMDILNAPSLFHLFLIVDASTRLSFHVSLLI